MGSNILLTQDFVAAARGLSEALAALLPSAAALADADPSQGAAAAAAATEAVQGLKSLQGRMASAKAAAGQQRRSSEPGLTRRCSSEDGTAAAADTRHVPIQQSGGGATAAAGLMGPPAPVDLHSAAAAAAVPGQSSFAQRKDFAFSPPTSADAPIRAAALPVPISGPRRSYDGSSELWRSQLSWTSRPRAASASGQGDAAMLGAGSFDSINLSMPKRFPDDGLAQQGGLLSVALKQHSPLEQQQQHHTAAGFAAAGTGSGGQAAAGAAGPGEGSGSAGALPAAGSGSPWGSEPMLLRQPSRRKSMEGSRLSLEEQRRL